MISVTIRKTYFFGFPRRCLAVREPIGSLPWHNHVTTRRHLTDTLPSDIRTQSIVPSNSNSLRVYNCDHQMRTLMKSVTYHRSRGRSAPTSSPRGTSLRGNTASTIFVGFCMMRVPRQTGKGPRPMHPARQGKSDLGVEKADWASDHCLCLSTFKFRPPLALKMVFAYVVNNCVVKDCIVFQNCFKKRYSAADGNKTNRHQQKRCTLSRAIT